MLNWGDCWRIRGNRRWAGCCNRNIMQRELQRPELEIHLADRELAPQLVRSGFLQLPLQQAGYRRPSQRPDHQQAANCPSQAALPAQRFHHRRGLGRQATPEK